MEGTGEDMTPLEIMTKTNYEAENGFGSWDLVSEESQRKLCSFMRAALLAPDELKIVPKPISHFQWSIFCAVCRAIATEGKENESA